ncbi:hypothetical protein NMG60_11002121 [Bertholletia excelsa]
MGLPISKRERDAREEVHKHFPRAVANTAYVGTRLDCDQLMSPDRTRPAPAQQAVDRPRGSGPAPEEFGSLTRQDQTAEENKDLGCLTRLTDDSSRLQKGVPEGSSEGERWPRGFAQHWQRVRDLR